LAFLGTLSGLIASLILWVALYAFVSESDSDALNALAPYLEATSPVGQGLFVVVAAVIALLAYRWLKARTAAGR
jgi:hypothetical protein